MAAIVVVLTSMGVYWAAEQRGRSGALWLIATVALVTGSYAAADFATEQLVGSNAMYDAASGAAALALVVAGPLTGIAAALLIAWWILKAPAVARLGRAVALHGGYGGEQGEWTARIDGRVLVLARVGQKERRIAADELDEVAVDGEYLSLRLQGEDEPLLLRPFGPKYPDRDVRVATVTRLADALRRPS